MVSTASPARTLAALRRLLLGLLTFGLVGTATDLLLIGHVEDAWQVTPLAMIVLALLATVTLALTSPATSPANTIRLFRAVMVLMILTGGVGGVLHYRANMEFKLEMDPSMSGLDLFSSVIRAKAPPAMAPANRPREGQWQEEHPPQQRVATQDANVRPRQSAERRRRHHRPPVARVSRMSWSRRPCAHQNASADQPSDPRTPKINGPGLVSS